MSGWFPNRLLVANVGGRALVSDTYSIGEWRCDPWPGFDLAEGNWDRVKGHEYRWGRRRDVEVPVAETRRAVREILESFRWGRRIELTGEEVASGWGKEVLVGFDNGQWVNRAILRPLHRLIDGPPHHYRRDRRSDCRPIHLFDERDWWLGSIMPVRMPRIAAKTERPSS